MCKQNSLYSSLLRWLRSLVPVWYVAPLEMKEGTHWGQGYNRSIRLQCRRRPNKATFNLLPQGKTRYPLCRRLGGPQGRSGQVRKISSPTGIRSPDRPARSSVAIPTELPGPHQQTVTFINSSDQNIRPLHNLVIDTKPIQRQIRSHNTHAQTLHRISLFSPTAWAGTRQ
jgi:hypothetical protein